jgi:hypothetical protein
MSETTPQEGKPNYEPEFDVIREVLDAQATESDYDEFDQESRALYNIKHINAKLADQAIRAAITLTECAMQYDGYDKFVRAKVENGQAIAKGYVAAINYGTLHETQGYLIHLVHEHKSPHPFFPDNDPVHFQHIIPASKITDYEYLPPEPQE